VNLLDRTIELRLDTTNHCNLRCVMCHMSYEKRTPRWMSLEDFQRVAEGVLPRVNVLFLSWGAEPLLNRDLPRILAHCRAARVPQVILTTNLMLLTEELMKDLVGGNVHTLYVSVDAADPEIFSRIRRNGDVGTVIGNIRALQERKRRANTPFPAIVFNLVLMKMNLDQLRPVIDLAAELGVREINCADLDANKGAEIDAEVRRDLAEQRVDPRSPEARERLRREYRHAANRGVFLNYPGRFDGLGGAALLAARITQVWNKSRAFTWRAKVALAAAYVRNRLLFRNVVCTYPWRQMVVSPDGLVLPCCVWPEDQALGNIADASLTDVWRGERFEELRRRLSRGDPPEKCRTCAGVATRLRHGV
jgi:radical SAM protein with 4Fe4S-binding SPASM domain